MGTEFTKGPWIIGRTYRTHNLPDRYWETDVTSPSGYVAKAIGATEEESRANANLLAASYELLEALKELSYLEPLCDDGDPLLTAAREAAKAAIARAEGK